MTAQAARVRSASLQNARHRLRVARAYVEAAELVLADDREEFSSVAAGLAVLAGIAASDAICAKGLGEVARGSDHREAARLLARASPNGPTHRRQLQRLLDLKDEAHYGLILVSASTASRAVRTARDLVGGAQSFVQS